MAKKADLFIYLKIIAVILLIALPFLASTVYRAIVAPDTHIRLAGGLPGGRYDEFIDSLVAELNENSLIQNAEGRSSNGSYHNLELLESREVDFALFQSGSDLKDDLTDEHKEILFVSNIFPEVAHLLVREGITQEQIENLEFDSVAVGNPSSGDYRVGIALLEHLGIDESSDKVRPMDYEEIIDAFKNNEIDWAIVSVGVGAEAVQTLISDGNCRLIGIPMRDAFLSKHVAYSSYIIPEGSYFSDQRKIPAEDLKSIAVHAQLLAHKDVASKTVGEILNRLNHANFLKKNRLRSLFVEGNRYALRQPEFELHAGAERYYDPSFRPFINPDFVEATEGIRSFVVSGLIGLFFLIRWIHKRNERSQAHKLDQFIDRLLEIEQEQIHLDRDYTSEESDTLEKYLDEITELRRQALTEFTAHDLNDDPAIECFISMSHGLTEKINAKLTRDAIRKSK